MVAVGSTLIANRVLGIDGGGTKLTAYVARPDEVGGEPVQRFSFRCADYRSLAEIIREVKLKSGHKITDACIAIAGPVSNGRVIVSKLDWTEITEGDLADQLGIDKSNVTLVNDIVGQGASLSVLPMSPSHVYHFTRTGPFNGFRSQGKWSVIAPGTGLGKSDVFFGNDGKVRISDSEGGGIRFGPDPSDEDQFKLLAYILRKKRAEAATQSNGPRRKNPDFISQDDVLKGAALKTMYDFFVSEYPDEGEPLWLYEAFQKEGDPNSVITKAALGEFEGKTSTHCTLAYMLYCSILGSVIGDEAVRVKGGVAICGGIFPKIAGGIEKTQFMKAYLGRNEFSVEELVSKKPVVGIVTSDGGVIGATEMAKPINKETFEVISS